MTEKKRTKITVDIHKKTYTIVGTESKERVELIAKLIDEKMNEIYKANKHLDTTRLAVLTAINIMNDHLTLKADYDELITLLEEDK